MANLKAAQDAKAAFLEANKEEGEADLAATELRIEGAVAAIDANDADDTDPNDLYSLAGFGADDSEGVKQAKIADKTKALSDEITAKETLLTTAKAAVAAKAGLASAMDTLNNREAALKNGQEAAVATQATVEGNIAEAASLAAGVLAANPTAVDAAILTTISGLTKASYVDGEITSVITKVDGKLKISDDVKNASVKAALEKLLTAVNADVAADDMVETLTTARDDAATNVKFIDAVADAKDGLHAAVEAAYGAGPLGGTAPANADALTHAQVKNALTALFDVASTYIDEDAAGATKGVDDLQAALEAGTADAVEFGVATDDAAAFGEVLTVYKAINDELTDFVNLGPENFPASNGQIDAQDALEEAKEAAEQFAELVADRAAAAELAAELKALEDKETEALDVFEELGFSAPETLVGTTVVASGEDDVYLVGTASTSVVGFGSEGADALYIGTDYSKNDGSLEDGIDTALEVFFIQSGNNAQVVLETKPYGSSEANVDEVVITLTGVNAGDLSLDADGFITLGA